MIYKTLLPVILVGAVMVTGCEKKVMDVKPEQSQEASSAVNSTVEQASTPFDPIAENKIEEAPKESIEDVREKLDSLGPSNQIEPTIEGKTSEELNADLINELDSIGQPAKGNNK